MPTMGFYQLGKSVVFQHKGELNGNTITITQRHKGSE